jgi:hypothetical protein
MSLQTLRCAVRFCRSHHAMSVSRQWFCDILQAFLGLPGHSTLSRYPAGLSLHSGSMKWIHSLNEKVAGSKVCFKALIQIKTSANEADNDLGLLVASPGRQLLSAEAKGQHLLNRD